MVDTLFQYPGGKSGQFNRILAIMPHHECFVEGFGGSGVVTLNKRKATVDVYNDLDSEIVHFFIVYREVPDRLVDWLEKVPYSYETYEDFVDAFYGPAGEEPDGSLPGRAITNNLAGPDDISRNDVKRAGVFFTLRYMQFGAKYQGRSGFGRSKVQNGAETFTNAKQRLREFAGCWDEVTIENVSYEKLIDSYDGDDTVFYFDPPYIGTEDYYRESDFDHQKFVNHLGNIDGYWIVSYDEIPEELEEYHVSREKSTNFIDSGVKGEGKETVETLITNFDPSSVRKWSSSGQRGLDGWKEARAEDNGHGAVSSGDELTVEGFSLSDEGSQTDDDGESGFLDDAI